MLQYTSRKPMKPVSRTIAPTESSATKASARFADNRPSFAAQAKMVQAIQSGQTIQRKVYWDNQPISKAYFQKKEDENPDSYYKPQTPGEANAMSDSYKRMYRDKEEFQDHANGRPVECGLIKNIDKWYRIDYLGSRKQFFVLGELHDAVSYRSILEESNQSGNALGEKGYMPIDEMSQGHTAGRVPKEEDVGGMAYFPMESILSKTLFALLHLSGTYKQGKSRYRQEDLGAVPKSMYKWQDTKTAGNAPFGAYHYPAYNMDNVALTLCGQCKTEIVRYLKTATDTDIIQELVYLVELLESIPENKTAFDWAPLIDQCKKCADSELERVGIASRRPAYPSSTADKEYESDEASYNANGNREAFMYQRILEVAGDNSYVMAGMGDEHAGHLKAPLEGAGIPVITFPEFMQPPYAEPAK